MNRWLQAVRETEAAEIAEAAMVMPVVFLFLLGIIWFGRAFNIYSTITQAAQQGAIAAARPSCATCAAPPGAWQSTTNFPGDTAVANTVTAVMQASSLDPSQIVPSASTGVPVFCVIPFTAAGTCSTTQNIRVCREVLLNQPAATGQIPVCGTTVSFQYPFQFYLPFTSLNLSRVLLSAQAQSRMEN